jgi:hypothetical protein
MQNGSSFMEDRILAYKGIIKGNTIELQDTLQFPEGTEVEVEVRERPFRGHPQDILKYLQTFPACNPEDVAVLMAEIDRGKKTVRFEGVFDQKIGSKFGSFFQ